MPVAVLTLELAIEHAQSLKDRRQVVRSLKDKLRHGFNVSVAELDEAVVWNRATVGVAAISGSAAYLAGQLRELEDAARRIAAGLGADITDSYIEADVVMPEDGRPCRVCGVPLKLRGAILHGWTYGTKRKTTPPRPHSQYLR